MFYIAVSAFAIGVGIATVQSVSLSVMYFFVLLAGVLVVVARRHDAVRPARHLTLIALALLMLTVGVLRTEIYKDQFEQSVFDNQIGSEVMFSGTVVREPDVRERSTHLYVETGDEIVLVIVDRHLQISYGDELLLSGEIEKPESFETDLGRTFDYGAYLEARGVTHVLRYPESVALSSGDGNYLITILLRVKHTLMEGIESVITEPQAGLAEGLLLGVKQALGDTLETTFRQSGIIHIVVLSGYNVMLVVAFFRFFMKSLPRWWQLGLGLLAIVAFALIVGLSATVVRATIMAGLVLLAGTLSRTYDVMRALFFAGFIMLMINPYLLLYDIGFQLSFMATLGLLLIAPRLETALAEGSWFGVKEFFSATVATQIAVLPLLLYHIGEVSVVAIVVNVLVLPVVPFAMFSAFIAGTIALLSPTIALPFGLVTSLLLSFIIIIATWFAALPFATVTVPAFSAYWILVLYAVMGSAYWFFQSRLKNVSVSDWEVVDKITLLKESGATQRVAPQSDTPVFFR
ncbi:hypothetical protein CL638_00455 [bacterium]|nr:hypothetical protein [bacterium]